MKRRLLRTPVVIAVTLAACAAPAPLDPAPRSGGREVPALGVRGRALGEPRFAHEWFVTAVAFSPDGERIATGCYDGSVRVFDRQGRERARRAAHADAVTFVGWLADGTLVSAGLDRKLLVGEIAVACSRVPCVSAQAMRVAWTADERTLAVVEPGGEIGRLPVAGITGVALSPSAERVAAIGTRAFSVWEVGGSSRVDVPFPGSGRPDEIRFLDETRLAARYDAHIVAVPVGRLRDLEREEPPTIARDAEQLAVGSDGTLVGVRLRGLGGDGDGTVTIERIARPRLVVGVPMARAAVALSPDGERVAVASYCGVVLLDTRTGEEVPRPAGHHGLVSALAFDGSTLASMSDDGRFIEWDAGGSPHLLERAVKPRNFARPPTGAFVRLDFPELRFFGVAATALSPSRRQLAIGQSDGVLRVIDRATRTEIRRWALDGRIESVGFSLDGGELAATVGGRLLRFALESGAQESAGRERCLGFGATPSGFVWLAATSEGAALQPAGIRLRAGGEVAVFSPRGDLVALGGGAKIPVCDARTGERVALLEGHRRDVTALAFSEDGALLASGDASGALRLWELRQPR